MAANFELHRAATAYPHKLAPVACPMDIDSEVFPPPGGQTKPQIDLRDFSPVAVPPAFQDAVIP